MRIIAFINDAGIVNKILDDIGESTQRPRIAPAHVPPLWKVAATAERARNDPQWDSSAQSAPGLRPCLGCYSGDSYANRDAC